MKYGMYYEIFQQPESMQETLKNEGSHMDEISSELREYNKIYLLGCGSSLSTCYSVRDAINIYYDMDISIFTGYEFLYHKKIQDQDSIVILTSQSGETADTLAALRKAKKNNLKTITITNEAASTMARESDEIILTYCQHEDAIVATKTYLTQLLCLYHIFFGTYDDELSKNILKDLEKLPTVVNELISETREDNKLLAFEFKDYDIFYCMGSGPNYGLAYKLAMTMFMEGALKHACPLYSGEFRHGLIERVEEGIPVIFLDADLPGDVITRKSIKFCEEINAKNIIFSMEDYSDLNRLLSPFILAIPLEWFIYYLAYYNNKDPGATRHIGKVRF
ncbi:MAG TPA: SIS domain-containing protein [Methanothermobacter sp.]|nr:glutamine--fructose-6-phosphate transaminase [Methanothermobacter sp. MT-2]HHW05316.1 SIS domain-containing protein [Methanothermobacter sp.]HOK72928.1 SIS domain-containing protein [Methanothermobacter sp.]HOL68986.1 SIS domain-containing protein [Methanothermobacter sp.]HPQ04877.1 SIS domain-containing protein [Methanothermobacter sp.]